MGRVGSALGSIRAICLDVFDRVHSRERYPAFHVMQDYM